MPGREFKPDIRSALSVMLAHAASHSPYYREQAWAKSLRGGASIALKNIPVTLKSLVREQAERFFCPEVPPSEGELIDKVTSGSTGEPMPVRLTERSYEINKLEDARLAKGWDFERHSCAVRIDNPNAGHSPGTIEDKRQRGRLLRGLYTGDPQQAFEFIRKSGASLLYARPSMLSGILQYGADIGVPLPVQLISTITEIVPPELRIMVGKLAGCRLVDKYGSVETGIMATQCADCGAYHPSDRQLILEILDDRDRPVRSGKMGRVVVTPLFNRAMPLIRYEIGDYAVVAKSQACSRSSLSLERISGRERNLFKMPDGRRIMPAMDAKLVVDLRLRHFKMVQRTLTDIEFQYVPMDPAAELHSEQAQELVDRCMAPGFRVHCVKVGELPRTASGKFLMHECLV